MTLTPASPTHTAFNGHHLLARGALAEVALAVKKAQTAHNETAILVFDDPSGKQVDLDLRGDDADIRRRYQPPSIPIEPPTAADSADALPRGRGRPKLGVVPREVTLLPRHWDWLAAQSGGASVALRKLVEQARRDNDARDRQRRRQEAAYHFMSSLAGNLPGFEEAARALYAGNQKGFTRQIAGWPRDVRDYATELAWTDPA